MSQSPTSVGKLSSAAMKAFIRKSKDKNKNVSSRVPDVAPTLSLPMVSVSSDLSETSPSPPLISPTLTAPSMTSLSSGTSSYGANAPLYARFARGPSALDFNDASSLTPPVSPPHTLRHRASTDSAKGGGSGFRSSGVRDEVERLAVTKRERSQGARSIRSVSGDSDSPRRVVTPQIQTTLPRPPTPPPPSPPKLVYAKYSPLPPHPKEETLSETSPSKSRVLTPPVPSARSASPPTLTPPASPSGARRAYSPLAAFYSKPTKQVQAQDQADTKSSLSPPLAIASSDTLSLNAPTLPSPPSPSSSTLVSSPVTPNTARHSPAYGPGMASMLRAASRNSRPTSPISPSANGVPTVPSPANGIAPAAEPTIGSYFVQYKDKARYQVSTRDGSEHGHSGSASESGNIESGNDNDIRPGTGTSNFSTTSSASVKVNTNLTLDLSSSTNVNSISDEMPTPRATAYLNVATTSPSDQAVRGNDDPAFQAFAASLPSTVNMSTSVTSPRVARGNRLSRQLSSGGVDLPPIDTNSVANPGPNTPSRIPLPVPIPPLEERGAISRKSSASGSLSGPNSTPGTPTSSRIGRPGALGKTESVRDRVRALEEERERERERGKVMERGASLRERKASAGVGNVGGVFIREKEKTNGFRERKVSTGRERRSSLIRERKASLGKEMEPVDMAGVGAIGVGVAPPIPMKDRDVTLPSVTQMSASRPSTATTINSVARSNDSHTNTKTVSYSPNVATGDPSMPLNTPVTRKPLVPGHQSKPSTLDLDADPFARSPPAPAVTVPRGASVDNVEQPTLTDGGQLPRMESIPKMDGTNGIIAQMPSIQQASSEPLPKASIRRPSLLALTHNPRESTASVYSEDGETESEVLSQGSPYPLERHLIHPYLLHCLLRYLSYADVLTLLSVNKGMRHSLSEIRSLREEVLERFLTTVGYTRWVWAEQEPLVLSLKDLNAYLRGVSIPMHEYTSIADAFIAQQGSAGVPSAKILRSLAASCRSFTRLVLRLRDQADAEYAARSAPTSPEGYPVPASPTSTGLSTSPPPSVGGHSRNGSLQHSSRRSTEDNGPVSPRRKFSSPLFRPHHAPLLRLFVPSPNGAWLSDESVLECEKELKRAGVLHMMRPGDVIWDTAVADEMNAGRLIWDGNYLIDLDYSYSQCGELPRYLHSLSFPPSYFHKVIHSTGNPLVQIDISPWGTEIAQNVQLVQDRIATETPQGTQHSILRWTHRTRCHIAHGTLIPGTDGLVVNTKWVGVLVIEAEGTNEGLADLLGRCGEEASQKAHITTGGLSSKLGKGDAGKVFRILRSKSRPGEIWMRCVREKERLS